MFSDSIWRLLAGSLELSQREFQILQATFDDDAARSRSEPVLICAHPCEPTETADKEDT
jgi:hypothetical protein